MSEDDWEPDLESEEEPPGPVSEIAWVVESINISLWHSCPSHVHHSISCAIQNSLGLHVDTAHSESSRFLSFASLKVVIGESSRKSRRNACAIKP